MKLKFFNFTIGTTRHSDNIPANSNFTRVLVIFLILLLKEHICLSQVLVPFYPAGTYTWTIPPSVTQIYVDCWGAGGAGGGSSNASYGGVGGGGGAYTNGKLNVTSGQTYNIVVGAGGLATVGGNGGNGGYSSFDYPTMVSGGGDGGVAGGPDAVPANGGTPGTPGASGVGYRGGNGAVPTGSAESGGGGGAAGSDGPGGSAGGYYGGWDPGLGSLGALGANLGFDGNGGAGASGTTSPMSGNPGDIWSGGGGGGLSGNGTSVSGGAGADGLVLIYYDQPFIWTGADGTSEWEDAGNWNGDGSHWPGQTDPGDIAVVNANPHGFLPVISAADGLISVGQIKISGTNITLTLGTNAYIKINCPSVDAGFHGGRGIELTNNGVLVADPTSTVDYAGDNTQTIGPAAYGNLKISTPSLNTWLKTIPGSPACTVSGDLSVLAAIGLSGPVGPVLRIDTQTVTIAGNMIQSGPNGGGYIYGTGGINMTAARTGSAIITPNNSGLSISNLTISGPVALIGGFTYPNGYNINSSLTVSSSVNSSFTIGSDLLATSAFTNYGTVTINNSRFLIVSAVSYSNSGVIQSGSSNGGTLLFQGIYTYSNVNIPSGLGFGGSFNSSDGSQISIMNFLYNYGNSRGCDQTMTIENTSSTVTVFNLNIGIGSENHIWSQEAVIIPAGKTLIVNGAFQNWDYLNGGGVIGPGTIQFNSSVNIPSGSGTYRYFSGYYLYDSNCSCYDIPVYDTSRSAGTFNSSPGTIPGIIIGSGATNNTVTATNGLTLNNITTNSGAVTALLLSAGDINVNGTTTFLKGNITTGIYNLIFGTTSTTTGASQSTGWVNGNIEKVFGAGTSSFNFAVGDATVYAPANMTMNGVSGTTNIFGHIASIDANESYVSGIDQSHKANRYWFIQAGGNSFTNYSATFDFSNCAPQGNIASYGLAQFNPNAWVLDAGSVNVGSKTITASGLTSFGDFEIGVAPPVGLTCANDTTVAVGGTQAEVNAEFAAWLLTATGSGGCNGQLSNNGNIIGAPNAGSGHTATVTFTYTSACAPLTTTCTARFTAATEGCTLNLKMFLQCYYIGGGTMNQVLYNEGVDPDPNSTQCDTITVSLVDPNNGNFVAVSKGVLQTNGSLTVPYAPGIIGNSYYIYIQHRTAIETSSANPVKISVFTNYDFSSSASQAYCGNEVEVDVGLGIWAIYQGDFNQDCYIDPFDFPQYDADVSNQITGVYVNTDLNGDGYVDPFDFPCYDDNNSMQITCCNPF